MSHHKTYNAIMGDKTTNELADIMLISVFFRKAEQYMY